MEKLFIKFIQRNNLFRPEQKILLAVSGGIDSMVMLELFRVSGFHFTVAHCNFRLRGEESQREAEFVANTAKNLKVPFFLKEFDTRAYAREHHLSIQEAARKLRYDWLDELLPCSGCEMYATAHHLDDQIETFFINLLRGSGLTGLSGIPVKSGNVIRPLLFASRGEIEEYARRNNVRYVEDSSNFSDIYLRNRIRHHVVPAIEKISKNYRISFQRSIENINRTNQFLRAIMDTLRSQLLREIPGGVELDFSGLLRYEHSEMIAYYLLKPFGFNRNQIFQIVKHGRESSGKRFQSPTHVLYIERSCLFITTKPDEKPVNDFDVFVVNPESEIINQPIRLRFSKFEKPDHYSPDTNPCIAQFDIQKLQFPLIIRRPQKGDRFTPLGLKGTKKLSDFFTDLKFSERQKQNTWLLISGDRIAWVIGQRIDDHFKISPSTQQILQVQWLCDT